MREKENEDQVGLAVGKKKKATEEELGMFDTVQEEGGKKQERSKKANKSDSDKDKLMDFREKERQ